MKNETVSGATAGVPAADSDRQRAEFVTIHVNEQSFEVRSGIYPVPKIKALAGVPPQDNLEQIISDVVTALDDKGKVEIKGGERFVSFPCTGGAS